MIILFETVSGLQFNFNKSMLIGVNVAELWMAVACIVKLVVFLLFALGYRLVGMQGLEFLVSID